MRDVEAQWADVIDALDGKHGDDQRAIAEQGLGVVAMLLEKNRAYGSSAFDPIRVFAKGLSALDQIHVRLDDKLSRVARGTDYGEEDVLMDIAGYCILGMIAKGRTA